ncbi:MAG: M28 family peptidase [Acidobacteriota bacterium]
MKSFLTLIVLLLIALTPEGAMAASTSLAAMVQDEPGDEQESRLLSATRQLIFEGRRSGEGYFGSQGSKLVFQSEREPENPFFQIYLMDLTTGDTSRVSPGFGKTTCAWIHPEGDTVLFASTHADPGARRKQQEELEFRESGQTRRYSWDYDEAYEIYTVDSEGTRFKNLTRTRGYDAEGSFSPDGKLIVFSSNRQAYQQELSSTDQEIFDRDKSYLVDVYLMNADGSEVRRLTENKGYDGGPFFSPDGEAIVWRRFSEDGATAEIYTMKTDGSQQRRVTRLGVMSWAPYYHPSGNYLIFSNNLHGFGNFELFLVDVEGKAEPVRVTFKDGFDSLPVFSPDGTQLVWTSTRTGDGKSQLFTAEWNHGEAQRLLSSSPESGASPMSRDSEETLPPAPPFEETRPEITTEDLRLHVSHLASDWMRGRLTGSEGGRRATEYVASVFQFLGLEPAGDQGTYFQAFEFTAGVSLGSDNRLTVLENESRPVELSVDQDWRPLAFSGSGSFDPAEVVFAGYGIVAPGSEENGEYDSYVHLAVEDKWVLVFRYLPEDVSPELRQHLSRYSSLRYKAMAARDRGARGLVVVSGPNSQVKQQLLPLSFDNSQAGTSIAVLSVTDALAGQWVQAAGKTLQDLQGDLDGGSPVMGFEIPDIQMSAQIEIHKERRTGNNVVGRLKAPGEAQKAVIVGAHVDHLGRGRGAGSLARAEEDGMIHYGADDNASGVGGILEIAQHLADQRARGTLPMKHDLLVSAWSGEELGLLGSSYFVRTMLEEDQSPRLSDQVVAYLNMDMIGRLRDSVVLQGVGSSPIWLGETERRNVPIGLPIVIQNDSYLPTDATSFYLKGVPILSAFTGVHADYHTPRDTADKVNYEGSAKIVGLMGSIARSLLTSEATPDYIQMERPASTPRANLRAYLGTIPDYSQSDVTGVKLSGVMKGAPAEEAGLEADDIVIELVGQKIENIYDYTYAIDALKVGVEVEVVVMRGNERITLKVTPGSRE